MTAQRDTIFIVETKQGNKQHKQAKAFWQMSKIYQQVPVVLQVFWL